MLYIHFIPQTPAVLDCGIQASSNSPTFMGKRKYGIGDLSAALIDCPTLGRRQQHVAQYCANIQALYNQVIAYTNFFVCIGLYTFDMGM